MLKISSIARDPAKDFGENIHQESIQEHETIELNNETQEQQDNSAHQGASSAPSIHFQSGNKCNKLICKYVVAVCPNFSLSSFSELFYYMQLKKTEVSFLHFFILYVLKKGFFS